MKRKLLSILLTLALCLGMMPAAAAAAPSVAQTAKTLAADDNAVKLYADYGSGFEYLTSICFGKKVSEQSVSVDRPFTALRIVRGNCYELDLDRLTLNGKCPAGFERKLSNTDNDLIEIGESMDFRLSGSGELVIASRAPVELMGPEYSFKFPNRNLGDILPGSYFYSYTLGSKTGSFSDEDVLVIPDKDYLFLSEMCHPASGHPDAPMDIYLADDGETLFVFFEAFLDNTFDHGKDFAGVHVKEGNTVKSYKVHTTETNEYGRWWFAYTDSSEDFSWEHMCYVVEIPLKELESEDGELDLAFEYYGTAYTGKKLNRLGIGSDFFVSESEHAYSLYSSTPLLPAAGKTVNSNGGSTETGEWWLTNKGTDAEEDYYLTLNGSNITTTSWNFENCGLYIYGNLTVVLAEGTVNSIDLSSIGNSGNHQYCIESSGQNLVIEGAGTLNLKSNYTGLYASDSVTIRGGAEVNAEISGECNYSSAYGFYVENPLSIDDAVIKANVNSSKSYVCGLYYSGYSGPVTIGNNVTIETYADGSSSDNIAFVIGRSPLEDEIKLNCDKFTLMKGDNASAATEVSSISQLGIRCGGSGSYASYIKIQTEETYPLYIAGTQVSKSTAADLSKISGVSGTASYDPASNTLILDGATITGMGNAADSSLTQADAGIVYRGTEDFTINVTGGASTITGGDTERQYSAGLFIGNPENMDQYTDTPDVNLNISEGASLMLIGSAPSNTQHPFSVGLKNDSIGKTTIDCMGTLTVKGADDVYFSYGSDVKGTLEISGSGTVNSVGGKGNSSIGLNGEETITISDSIE
ncbi:MAG: carbohydrate-binding domain-containing protein, partial [Firmicutes bacterium]|nr:carbohydrate-binding domain-containing protein [Bacillota bacterium]